MHDVVTCPVCGRGNSHHHATIDAHPYYHCDSCASLHIHPDVIMDMDRGISLVGEYAANYWEQERVAALERASGLSLCRAGEAILYCRRPVRRFLDVGGGPGFLGQNLQALIDPDANIVHSVEKFPPPYAVRHPNFHEGDAASLEGPFDAGVCIEVVEHLTPTMVKSLAAGLAKISVSGSFWLFNTGMPRYVLEEDPGYLDPLRRGHIVSYSLDAVKMLLQPFGFNVGQLPGKSFAFYAEFQPEGEPSFDERIYKPIAENLALLNRNRLLYHAAFETARSYLYYEGYLERTAWALSLEAQLRGAQQAW